MAGGWGWIGFDGQREVGRSELVYGDEKEANEAFVRDAPAAAFQRVIVGPAGPLTSSPVVVERGLRKPRSVAGYEPELFVIHRLEGGLYRYTCKACGWSYNARRHADVAPHACFP